MNENQQIVENNQNRRYELLIELWKAVDGKPFHEVNIKLLANSLGINQSDFLAIHWYFQSEGLFADAGDEIVSLSHKAIVEIENSLTQPNQSTEHFSSTVIQNFNAPVGAVTNGNSNIANVNQNIGQNLSEILNDLDSLKNKFQTLPTHEKEEAIEVVDALAEEIQKENPSKGKVKAFLSSTKDFAVKTGTELAASTIAKVIESQIGIIPK